MLMMSCHAADALPCRLFDATEDDGSAIYAMFQQIMMMPLR